MAKQSGGKTLFSVFTTIELIIIGVLFAAIVLPLPFGIKPSVVLTASMSPKIPAGSVAWCNTNFVEQDLQPGTIAVYEPQLGTEVMHRIIAVDNGVYTFQGDANDAPDAASPTATSIEGVYMFHIPQIGQMFTWIMDNKIWVLLGFVILNVGVYALSATIGWLGDRNNKQGQSET